MKFRFIMENQGKYRLGKMCEVLEVSRSGYHKYIKSQMRCRKMLSYQIAAEIKRIHIQSQYTYGVRRIRKELLELGIKCNRKRISRVMRENGLKAKAARKYKVTTKSSQSSNVAEDLVKQNFFTMAPNKLWVSDITYIWTLEGWLYLVIIMDMYSRKIVGWSLSNRLLTEFVVRALEQALSNRVVERGMIFHSDRGVQYTSERIRKVLVTHSIRQSMSRKGNCYDNAAAESFFHTLKTELIHFTKYTTRQEARSSIFEYIEIFYNRQRKHSALDYMSPVDFESKQFILAA